MRRLFLLGLVVLLLSCNVVFGQADTDVKETLITFRVGGEIIEVNENSIHNLGRFMVNEEFNTASIYAKDAPEPFLYEAYILTPVWLQGPNLQSKRVVVDPGRYTIENPYQHMVSFSAEELNIVPGQSQEVIIFLVSSWFTQVYTAEIYYPGAAGPMPEPTADDGIRRIIQTKKQDTKDKIESIGSLGLIPREEAGILISINQIPNLIVDTASIFKGSIEKEIRRLCFICFPWGNFDDFRLGKTGKAGGAGETVTTKNGEIQPKACNCVLEATLNILCVTNEDKPGYWTDEGWTRPKRAWPIEHPTTVDIGKPIVKPHGDDCTSDPSGCVNTCATKMAEYVEQQIEHWEDECFRFSAFHGGIETWSVTIGQFSFDVGCR